MSWRDSQRPNCWEMTRCNSLPNRWVGTRSVHLPPARQRPQDPPASRVLGVRIAFRVSCAAPPLFPPSCIAGRQRLASEPCRARRRSHRFHARRHDGRRRLEDWLARTPSRWMVSEMAGPRHIWRGAEPPRWDGCRQTGDRQGPEGHGGGRGASGKRAADH